MGEAPPGLSPKGGPLCPRSMDTRKSPSKSGFFQLAYLCVMQVRGLDTVVLVLPLPLLLPLLLLFLEAKAGDTILCPAPMPLGGAARMERTVLKAWFWCVSGCTSGVAAKLPWTSDFMDLNC